MPTLIHRWLQTTPSKLVRLSLWWQPEKVSFLCHMCSAVQCYGGTCCYDLQSSTQSSSTLYVIPFLIGFNQRP